MHFTRKSAVLGCLCLLLSVAVILPAVMARIVGLDCGLNALARRMRCTQCESRRVAVRAVEPGER